jgi:hypothetical protein
MPAKPVTPALPFQYFGRLTENGKTEIFVMRGDELLSIAPGQTLGEYRVDSIGDKDIAFTYLPPRPVRLDFNERLAIFDQHGCRQQHASEPG